MSLEAKQNHFIQAFNVHHNVVSCVQKMSWLLSHQC